jgi:hypothetical protein
MKKKERRNKAREYPENGYGTVGQFQGKEQNSLTNGPHVLLPLAGSYCQFAAFPGCLGRARFHSSSLRQRYREASAAACGVRVTLLSPNRDLLREEDGLVGR